MFSSKMTPGRAVQLAHHHALRPVDDEGAQLGEEREVPQVDFLLDDVPGSPLPVFQVLPDDEPQRRLEGRRVGHVSLDALLHGVFRLSQRGRDILQREVLVHVTDGEDLPEDAIQSEIPLFLEWDFGFNELFKGTKLDVKQVRHRHDRPELGEAQDRPTIAPNIQRDFPLLIGPG